MTRFGRSSDPVTLSGLLRAARSATGEGAQLLPPPAASGERAVGSFHTLLPSLASHHWLRPPGSTVGNHEPWARRLLCLSLSESRRCGEAGMLCPAKAHLHHRAHFFTQRAFSVAAQTPSFCLFALEGCGKNEKISRSIPAITRFLYSFTCNLEFHGNLYLHLINVYFLKCLLFGTIFVWKCNIN